MKTDIQIANEATMLPIAKIAEELGVDIEIKAIEWDGLIPALEAGEIDMIIAGMSPTEERKLSIDFSDTYFDSELVMVVRKDGAYTAATQISDFSGAKITGQLNTFHYTVIDQIDKVKKLPAMETFPAMIVALPAGAIDGYISERPGAVSAMASNPSIGYVAFEEGMGFEASPEDVAIAVGVTKGSDLTEKIKGVVEEGFGLGILQLGNIRNPCEQQNQNDTLTNTGRTGGMNHAD